MPNLSDARHFSQTLQAIKNSNDKLDFTHTSFI